MRRSARVRAYVVALSVLAGAGTSFCALAQGAQGAYPSYPGAQAYPQAQYPAQTTQPRSAMRDIFAASLAAVVAASGGAAVTAVSAGLNGAITGWLDRKSRPKGAAPGYATNGYTGNGFAPTSDYPSYPGTAGAPAPAYPGDTGQSQYPTQDPSQYPANTYPSYPGDSSQQGGNVPQPAGVPPADTYPQAGNVPQMGGVAPSYPGAAGSAPIYAGVAFEIHLLGPGGRATPVDPSSYVFRTGDRFKVLYRPSLPGRVDVFNVNAGGQTAQIDTVSVAAGQLASLGPYEFADMTGNETLILQLSPCSTNALLAATRNIVKVPDSAGGGAPLQLSACGGAATRGLRTKTRDIRKVSVEQGTSFALDPLAPAELSSGDIAPRQVTITLAHR